MTTYNMIVFAFGAIGSFVVMGFGVMIQRPMMTFLTGALFLMICMFAGMNVEGPDGLKLMIIGCPLAFTVGGLTYVLLHLARRGSRKSGGR